MFQSAKIRRSTNYKTSSYLNFLPFLDMHVFEDLASKLTSDLCSSGNQD